MGEKYAQNKQKRAWRSCIYRGALLITLLALSLAACDTSGGTVTGHVDETGATGLVEVSEGNYYIYDAQGSKEWAALDDALSSNVTLKACITWDASDTWTPVGSSSGRYVGTFDGGGHTIYRLSIESSDEYVGFFGYIGSGGKVKDLTLDSPSVAATGNYSYVGGIAGFNNGGTIEGCTVSGGEVAAEGSSSNAGGIAGCNDDGGTVKDCANSGTVAAKGESSFAGGIAGCNSSIGTSIGTVTGCANSGTVAATGTGSYAGGIVGCNDGGTVTGNTNSGSPTKEIGNDAA